MTVDVRDASVRHRYEISEDGTVVGYLTYRLDGGALDLVHAEVDPDHSGRGLAARLVTFALDDARSRGLDVLPHCPYVRHVVDERREYLDLVPVDRRQEFGW